MIGNEESALPDTEVHYLHSKNVGDEFKILVGHCGASASAPPPVVFVSDALMTFGTAVDIVRLLALMNRLPPLLVVGIGYRVATIKETLEVRTRDFTPTVGPVPDSSDPAMMGGAGRFLAFLCDELKPWVCARYAVDPDDFAFFGDSLGGLFGTYVLFTAPSAFQRYGIGSPSFYWDDEVIFEHEARYAESHADLPAKVFFSVGEFESTEGDKRVTALLPPDQRAEAEASVGAYTYDNVARTVAYGRVIAWSRVPGSRN
jgi:hypothetical protein